MAPHQEPHHTRKDPHHKGHHKHHSSPHLTSHHEKFSDDESVDESVSVDESADQSGDRSRDTPAMNESAVDETPALPIWHGLSSPGPSQDLQEDRVRSLGTSRTERAGIGASVSLALVAIFFLLVAKRSVRNSSYTSVPNID